MSEIILLTKEGCGACRILKILLNKLKVDFSEEDYLAYEEEIKRAGFYSLPILKIGKSLSQPRDLEELRETLLREGFLE